MFFREKEMSRKERLLKPLKLLLKHRKNVANKAIKNTKILSKKIRVPYNEEEISINSDIYSLWLTHAILREDEFKDWYHDLFDESQTQEYLKKFYAKSEIHYPLYYEAYNNLVKTKNGMLLGGLMTNIFFNDDPKLLSLAEPTGVDTSTFMWQLFSKNLNILYGYLFIKNG